ncbi:4'-phosphopantetheinyl transferase family protein [Patulibacter americanus]|uniref:4'-phosphopantetheinyl transferase family protein n=1 Tax=Patulibacter americanus TaxID=588672 RepID=UPI000425D8F8|nr:4'-phosphopantetheinyl transferase superfamily protein [Patulibacter americanus]
MSAPGGPGLPPGVAVHRALATEPDEAVLALLDEAERERLARLRRPADRARFATGRRLARTALGALLGVAPAEVPLTVGPAGRPRVADAAALDLSVAHAGAHVFVAVADGGRRVGVDVEGGSGAPLPDAGLLGVVCTPSERAALAGLEPGPRHDAFLALWTRKEAVLKADGRGLLVDPTTLELALEDPPRVLVAPAGVPGPDRLTLRDLDAARGYRAALAVVAP